MCSARVIRFADAVIVDEKALSDGELGVGCYVIYS